MLSISSEVLIISAIMNSGNYLKMFTSIDHYVTEIFSSAVSSMFLQIAMMAMSDYNYELHTQFTSIQS